MKNSIQNVYDNPTFFEGYKNLRQGDQGFNNLLEQPAIRALLPNVKDKVALDIGCGFGDFCAFLLTQGIKQVIGIDPSEKMIAEAKQLSAHENIIYRCAPVESAIFDSQQFDFIFSSLAFHYVEDYAAVIKKIAHWLKPNGELLFSIEHSICTANSMAQIKSDEQGRNFFPLYNYRDEQRFYQTWFIEGVEKYHRTVSTYVNTLLEQGFSLCHLSEPMPTDEMIAQRNAFQMNKIRPPLLVNAMFDFLR